MPAWEGRAGAVSYTHLDVYKRQAVESDTKLYWTDPLPCLRSEKLTFIGSDPFQRMRAVALARKAPAWKRFGPWLVPAAALTAYSWAMGSLWAEYAQAHAQYQTCLLYTSHQQHFGRCQHQLP